jgi:hypothetical protein
MLSFHTILNMNLNYKYHEILVFYECNNFGKKFSLNIHFLSYKILLIIFQKIIVFCIE